MGLRGLLFASIALCHCSCGHGAGVCCIRANYAQDFLVYTGSYDEHIRSWDLRKLTCPIDQVFLAVQLLST